MGNQLKLYSDKVMDHFLARRHWKNRDNVLKDKENEWGSLMKS
ncbi:MAG: hypothetical protein ABSC14_06485 [Desulfomonilia bacterium]|jgi:hypothetical protein